MSPKLRHHQELRLKLGPIAYTLELASQLPSEQEPRNILVTSSHDYIFCTIHETQSTKMDSDIALQDGFDELEDAVHLRKA